MKITRYVDEYIDINGHHWIGVRGIVEDRVMLHLGCDCGQDKVVTIASGDCAEGPEDLPFSFQVDVGTDDQGSPHATFTLDGMMAGARRMEEIADGKAH